MIDGRFKLRNVEPASDAGGIPTCASAQRDFQLVPTQHPVELAALMADQFVT